MSTPIRVSRSVTFTALASATLALVVVSAQQPPAPAPGQPPAPGQTAGAKPEAAGPTGFATSPALKFRAQEIATDFGVGSGPPTLTSLNHPSI